MTAKSEKMRSCIKSCHISLASNPTVTFGGEEFPHDRHGKVGCETCHRNEPAHGELTVTKNDCTSCHHKSIDDCSSCHSLQAAVLAGKGDGATLPTHARKAGLMSEDVPCEACHTQQAKEGDPPRATPAACDECHDKGIGKAMTSLWQGTTRKFYRSSSERLLKIERNADAGNSTPRATTAIRAARVKLEAIERDGSWGVHNPPIVDILLQEADVLISEAAILAKLSSPETTGENK